MSNKNAYLGCKHGLNEIIFICNKNKPGQFWGDYPH